MNGPHTHDSEHERLDWTEELAVWAFEQDGFTEPRATESAPALVLLPRPGRARRHLTLLDGGRK